MTAYLNWCWKVKSKIPWSPTSTKPHDWSLQNLKLQLRLTGAYRPSGASRISVRGILYGVGLEGGRAVAPGYRRIFECFQKISLKMAKMYYFSLFFKNFKNLALVFRAFGRKYNLLGNFLWKFNRKIESVTIFGKVIAKIRAFGNKIIFL